MFLCFYVYSQKKHVFMYFLHLVPPFTPHYIRMVKGLLGIVLPTNSFFYPISDTTSSQLLSQRELGPIVSLFILNLLLFFCRLDQECCPQHTVHSEPGSQNGCCN